MPGENLLEPIWSFDFIFFIFYFPLCVLPMVVRTFVLKHSSEISLTPTSLPMLTRHALSRFLNFSYLNCVSGPVAKSFSKLLVLKVRDLSHAYSVAAIVPGWPPVFGDSTPYKNRRALEC
jgi:hypothetical protein